VKSPFDRMSGPLGSRSTFGLIAKLLLLGVVNAIGVFAAFVLIDARQWSALVVVIAATAAIDLVYLSKRAIPAKYLVPGTVMLLAFQIYPVLYNSYIAFTNFGTGNFLNKGQAVERILANSLEIPPDAVRYALIPLADDGEIALLLTDPDGQQFLGTADGLLPLAPEDIVGEGAELRVGDFRRMNLREANDRQQEVFALEVPIEDGALRVQTFTSASRAVQTLTYDPDTDTMVDAETGESFRVSERGFFVSDDGRRLSPGWRVTIGFENFSRVLTSPAIRDEFFRVLVWTFVFAIGSVVTTFVLGLAFAMALNDQRVKGRKIYRALLIIPYALPSFMTALIWRGLLNTQFGAVNKFLGLDIPWLTSQAYSGALPKLSVLLVNLWLGFPYMFLITTGALQSIPDDLKEAAFVDGASGWQAFRRITLPLLLVATAPLLIASFAFNFNNFNVIYLLTRGDPPISGAATPVGHTDILISYSYRLAFAGGRGADYGLAAAISVMIFLIVAVVSAVSFMRTRALEDIN
jgi:arabinogalactan oligomer / maltooligosaccharide transport system permease protein